MTIFQKRSISDLQPWHGDLSPLECIQIDEVTADVKSFSFRSVEPAYFDFYPGQHITLILDIFGEEICRTYTIASSPTTPFHITITNKRLPNGVVTQWMHNVLKVGDRLDAMSIGGRFSPVLDDLERKLLLLSGGSGITPMLSISRYLQGHALNWDTVFIHSAQSKEDFIEYQDISYIESQLEGFRALWVADNGDVDVEWEGLSGFMSAAMLLQEVPDFLERQIYCCGPSGYMDNIKSILVESGFDMQYYHQESFDFAQSSAQATPPESTPASQADDLDAAGAPSEYAVTLTKSQKLISVQAEANLLEELKRNGIVVPFGCTAGLCGTCRTKLLEGQVDMQHQGGLLKRHEQQGYILPCCSSVQSDLVLEL